MQERLEREKKEESESVIVKSELTQEIEQLTQILEFVKEVQDKAKTGN